MNRRVFVVAVTAAMVACLASGIAFSVAGCGTDREATQRREFEGYLQAQRPIWEPLSMALVRNSPPLSTTTLDAESVRFERIASAFASARSRMALISPPADLEAWYRQMCDLLGHEHLAWKKGSDALLDLSMAKPSALNRLLVTFPGSRVPKTDAERARMKRRGIAEFKKARAEVLALVPEYATLGMMLEAEAERLGASMPTWYVALTKEMQATSQ